MACLAETRNTLPPLDAEVESVITDAAASSLSAFQAAAQVLHKVGGITALQIVAAAINALREQKGRHQEATDDAVNDLEGQVSDLEDEVDDLKDEIARKATGATGATP